MENKLSMIVNGKACQFDLEGTGAVPATETLRETLQKRVEGIDLKRNCNHGVCGACTVLLNGRAVNSCMILSVSCQNARILTFEGLSRQEYRLYEIFRDSGYFDRHAAYIYIRSAVMLCIAQFYEKENPSDRDFISALSENCGQSPGTEQIIELIHQYQKETLPPRE